MLSITGCSTTEPRKPDKIKYADEICYRSNHHLWWQIPTYGVVGLYAVGGFMALATGGDGLYGAVAGAVSGVGLSFWKWEVPCDDENE